MILRRITDAFRKQDWFTVAVETLIVVFGVFIGLQVNNWNAARIEQAQEQEYLIRLKEDFAESVAGQTRDIRFLDQQLSDQAVILKSLKGCAVAPEDSEAFQRGANTLGYINPPRFFRRTVDEMAAAGTIDIIRNDEIKEELAGIVALVEWRSAGFDQTSRLTEHYRFIIEEQVQYNLTRTYADPYLGDFVGVDFDIETLCQNPLTASAVSAISYTTRERQRAYRPILDRFEAFLPMLDESLSKR
ncbi:hypothetical protein [Hyphomonas sp.]|jgi:hypothetical protein|uniref:hypothetical protein n=1 Tax=Hyphomonas sp. TaxID=87 RepID=UPI0039E43FC0